MASRKEIEKAANSLRKSAAGIEYAMNFPLFFGGGGADLIEAHRLISNMVETLERMIRK